MNRITERQRLVIANDFALCVVDGSPAICHAETETDHMVVVFVLLSRIGQQCVCDVQRCLCSATGTATAVLCVMTQSRLDTE